MPAVILRLIKSRLIPEIDSFEIYRCIQDYLFSTIDLFDLLTHDFAREKYVDNYSQLELKYV